MAAKTGTYTLIASQSATGSSSTITFNSIPSTYTDLILIVNASTTATDMYLRLNSDTGTNYSQTILTGTGTTASSTRVSNRTSFYLDWNGFAINSIQANAIVHIMDYSNTSTYKTILQRFNDASYDTEALVGLWRSTAAINTVTVIGGGNFISGSTFKLYGIEAGNQ